MLGRTANGAFWMARYLERAENTARLIEAGFRMALTRDAATAHEEWRSLIATLGQTGGFEAAYGPDYAGERVWNFLLRAPANPGSVLNQMELARTDARGVRTALIASHTSRVSAVRTPRASVRAISIWLSTDPGLAGARSRKFHTRSPA